MSTLNIEELKVNEDIKQGLKKLNIGEVTVLEQRILTDLPEGRGLIVKSTPKENKHTVAVSAVGTSMNHAEEGGTKCLILTSSADNVEAISEQVNELGVADLTCAAMNEQMEAQQKKSLVDKEPDLLVAQPCALKETMRKLRYVFRHVQYIILDGLDVMNTEQQRSCLKQIRLRTLSDYTSLIFVSKLEDDVKKLASRFSEEPASIDFSNPANGQMTTSPVLTSTLKQGYINVPPRMKISTLMAIVQKSSVKKMVIFTASKRGTERLYKILKKQNLRASSIHGRLSEDKKVHRLERFTDGKASYLLVADIPAAELGLSDIDRVINYDVPSDTDEYRCRAAILRSPKSDGIISLVSGQDKSDIQELQKELNTKMSQLDLPKSIQKKVKNQQDSPKKKQKKEKEKNEMELPRPSYDKLSGGRNGNRDEEESGIVQLFKKLFSS